MFRMELVSFPDNDHRHHLAGLQVNRILLQNASPILPKELASRQSPDNRNAVNSWLMLFPLTAISVPPPSDRTYIMEEMIALENNPGPVFPSGSPPGPDTCSGHRPPRQPAPERAVPQTSTQKYCRFGILNQRIIPSSLIFRSSSPFCSMIIRIPFENCPIRSNSYSPSIRQERPKYLGHSTDPSVLSLFVVPAPLKTAANQRQYEKKEWKQDAKQKSNNRQCMSAPFHQMGGIGKQVNRQCPRDQC